jgi:hypothetical protein
MKTNIAPAGTPLTKHTSDNRWNLRQLLNRCALALFRPFQGKTVEVAETYVQR